MSIEKFSALIKYSGKCAGLQTINLDDSKKYSFLIDNEVNKLKERGIVFNLNCKNKFILYFMLNYSINHSFVQDFICIINFF